MTDALILSIPMASAVVLLIAGTMIYLHFDQKRDLKGRTLELKIFQMENTRLIQEWRNESRRSHEDSMEYLKGITGSLARIIRKQEEGEGGAK